MNRPKKRKIELNSTSLINLMQEIYDECQDLKQRAVKEINERKNGVEIENTSDVYQVGKVNNESLKIIDSVIDKKLSLVKLQSAIVSDTSTGSKSGGLSDDDKKMLRDMIKKKEEDNNIEYSI